MTNTNRQGGNGQRAAQAGRQAGSEFGRLQRACYDCDDTQFDTLSSVSLSFLGGQRVTVRKCNVLMTGFSQTLTFRPQALAENDAHPPPPFLPTRLTKTQAYLPFPSSSELLELFHVDGRLLAAQRLLGVFWLQANARESENHLAKTHLETQRWHQPLIINRNFYTSALIFAWV